MGTQSIPAPPGNSPVPQSFTDYAAGLVAFVQSQYGLTFILSDIPVTPQVGVEVDAFWVFCQKLPKNGWQYFGQAFQDSFGPDYAALAKNFLTVMAYPDPPPQPLAAPPIPPKPPATNPVGLAYLEGTGANSATEYTDLWTGNAASMQTVPLGGTFVVTAENQNPGGAPPGTYTRKGRRTPFGLATWWV